MTAEGEGEGAADGGRRVAAGALAAGIVRLLAGRGLPEEHARLAADTLVTASLRGVDSHGVRLLPVYLEEIAGGRCRPDPELRWSGEGAARVLDAGGALGPVAGRLGAAEAVALARRHGVGAVAVGDSNHFGAASCHTLAMAREGMLGLAMTNSDALVAPFNGTRPLFGTNPVSFALAAEDGEILCADFTTSQGSFLKLRSRLEAGLPVPPGWAVTTAGRDAAEAAPGEGVAAMMPLGGHKGQCLGMMVEIFCALLAGMPFDHELTNLYDRPYDEPRRISHFFLALDLAAFGDPGEQRRRLGALMALVRSQPGMDGGRVLCPGDLETATARERSRRGIPLSADEAAALTAAGLELPG